MKIEKKFVPQKRRTVCRVCGRQFNLQNSPTQKRCRACIRAKLKIPTEEVKEYPSAFYVYGWYVPGELLPYYVGKGFKNRAWRKNSVECCREVRIYRDNLTEEGAYLVEAVLIAVFRSLGANLKNTSSGTLHQEIPPLHSTTI